MGMAGLDYVAVAMEDTDMTLWGILCEADMDVVSRLVGGGQWPGEAHGVRGSCWSRGGTSKQQEEGERQLFEIRHLEIVTRQTKVGIIFTQGDGQHLIYTFYAIAADIILQEKPGHALEAFLPSVLKIRENASLASLAKVSA